MTGLRLGQGTFKAYLDILLSSSSTRRHFVSLLHSAVISHRSPCHEFDSRGSYHCWQCRPRCGGGQGFYVVGVSCGHHLYLQF